LRAVSFIERKRPCTREGFAHVDPAERVCLETRRHGIVLARPFAKVFALASAGGLLYSRGWPLLVIGAAFLIGAALLALRAVWRWERTRVVVTTRRVMLMSGTLRRRTSTADAGQITVEQSALGRLLGYGTLIAGSLAIRHVPEARRVRGLVERSTA
jgi:lysylphosphatidylglycerol synthetase-like protein (DUF2156 family)